MIGVINIKVSAHTPNLPLQPLFAFKGSPSSLRIMDVPKSIGQWNINEVSVLVKYPDNSQDEKQAVRTGNVWVATVEGCDVTGRVVKGYEVLANGVDEDGNPVVGYVLGSGDVFVLERDSSIPEKDVEKFYVKFCETLPAKPQKGDVVDDGGTVKMYDGTKWIDMGGAEIGDATITIQKNGTSVGSFTTNQLYNSSINIPVPSTTNDLVNDSGFITSAAIPSNVGAFTNDVGYLTTSSQAFIDKRDKTDMSAVVGTTYASWNLSALHSTTYSPSLELKWGTYNVFGEEQGCWLVDDEYRQVCFFLLPELNMLYWGYKNQDGGYIAAYGETITLSSDELSVATINGVAEITCTRTSKEGSPEISTIATLKDLSEYEGAQGKRDWWDNTYPASVDDSGKYTINNFSVMVGSNSYVLDQFSKSVSTSTWKTTGGDYPSITTTDGLNFALNTDSSTYSNFSISQLKPGPATGTVGGNNYSAYANFKLTTFALKDALPSKTSDLVNDSGFITASAIPSNVGAFTNDAGYITASAIPSSYSSIMDSSGCVVNANLSAVYYEEVSKWVLTFYGKTYTLDGPKTSASWSASAPYSQDDTRGTLTRGDNIWFLDWDYYDGSDWETGHHDSALATTPEETSLQFNNVQVQSCVWTSGFSELVSGTLATKSDLQDVVSAIPSNVSELNNDVVYITADAIPPIPSKTSDLLNDSGFITSSAIPSNVGAFTNDVGYLTASSSSFTNKRDYDDLTYPGTVYPSETHRIREFDLNIEGGYNPSRYTLNKFSTNVPNYGSMWANDEEYWNFAVATSNGEDFTFNKYGESGEVATFTMADVTAGAITFTMTDDQIEYTCHLSASMYETSLALKDYVDSVVPSNTITISGIYSDLTSFAYNVYTT